MRAWLLALAPLVAAASTGVLGGSAAMAADPVAPTAAPQGDKLTLARVFGNPDLSGSQPRQLTLSPDGTLLTFLRPRADEKERLDLWARDTRTGAERMLVDSKKIGSGAELSEAEKMQRERARIAGSRGIVAYNWTPDGRAILVPLDGKLYLAGLDGTVRPVAAGARDPLNPAVSPRGGYVSWVEAQNLHVTPLAGGTGQAVTADGAGTVHWGEAEFVAQEEMKRFTGYWWSPDERRIAVERFDEAPVHVFTRAAIGASGTRTFDQRYPAAGTPNALVELYVMAPDGSGRVKVDLGPNPDIYLARVDWTPDGSALLVQRQSRDQKTLDLLRVDPATGKAVLLFTEKAGAKSWLNLEDTRPLKDGSILWQSERSGYSHLYRFVPGKPGATGRWTQLTSGPWVVTGVVGVDQDKGRIYFEGTKDDVLENQVYAVDFAHPDAITRLTERGWTNAATMDRSNSRLIVRRSSPSQPTQVYLADTAGQRLGWINENAVAPGHPYYPYLAAHQQTKFGAIQARRLGLLAPRVHRAVRRRAARHVPGGGHRRGPQPGGRAPGRALDRRVGRLVRGRRRRRGAGDAPRRRHDGHPDRPPGRRDLVRSADGGRARRALRLAAAGLDHGRRRRTPARGPPPGTRPGPAPRRCWRTRRTTWASRPSTRSRSSTAPPGCAGWRTCCPWR